MRKLLASLLFVLSFSGLMAGSAQAHHVISLDVDVNCDGFSGQAVLEVFDGHKYQVTAPGFDTGIVTTDEDSTADDDVTVPFSGTATSGTATATIFYPTTGAVEDTKSQPFELKEECEPETEQTPSPPPPTTPPPAVAEPSPSPTAPAVIPPAPLPSPSPAAEEKVESKGSVASAEEVREDVLPAELARTGPAAVALYLTGLGLAMLVVALLAHVAASRRRRASQ